MTSSRDGLSRSELRTWRRFTTGTASLFQALDRDLRHESGLSLDDFALLRPLWAAPEAELRMGDLADQLSFSQSRVSHTVQRMEDRGWVTREASAKDRRAKVVRLTPAGQALFADAWPRHAHLIRELFLDQLDDHEREILEHAFAKIRRPSRESHPRT